MKKNYRKLLFILVFISLFPTHAISKTVSLPITIDYNLLRSLVISTAFTDPEQTAIVANEGEGCIKITVSEPTYKKEKSWVKFETRVHVHAGLIVANRCVMPVEWEGYLVIYQTPMINPNTWELSFQAMDSALFNLDRKPAKLAGLVWKLTKTHVYDYLSRITVHLAPPVSELKTFLLPLFPEKDLDQTKRMIDNMRSGGIVVLDNALRVDILTDVKETFEKEKDIITEPLTQEEQEKFIASWENWDTFLVKMILSLSKKPLSNEEKQLLLDMLLETRYQFISELTNPENREDFVRDQFITVWKHLSPVFRNHLIDGTSKTILGYLAFFTASDALPILDRIGPTMGIEISRNGLIRLARLVADDESLIFSYQTGEDMTLRETLGLRRTLTDTEHRERIEGIKKQKIEKHVRYFTSLTKGLFSTLFMPPMALATEPKAEAMKMEEWILTSKNFASSLEKIKTLLDDRADNTLKSSKLDEKYHDLYRLIVPSVAWQESCLRQFLKKKGKVVYIRSYNNTSVGIMQINERVWRGMYEIDHLQWNIAYNIRAGCEIIDLYFNRYLLRKMKKLKIQNLDNDTMARILYAMYNGGPSQFSKFLKRNKINKFYLSDKLYFEKYNWVKNNQWVNLKTCL